MIYILHDEYDYRNKDLRIKIAIPSSLLHVVTWHSFHIAADWYGFNTSQSELKIFLFDQHLAWTQD